MAEPKTKIKINVKKREPWAPTDAIPEKSIISFDVGIINLAYCILSSDEKGYHIYDWNIINLACGDIKLKCTAHLKNGSVCGKKAHYVDRAPSAKGAKGATGYCTVHGKGQGFTRNMTVENASEFELKKTLFQALDAEPRLLKVDRILIEHQPLKAREKIKGIGHALFDYYVLRGIIDNRCNYSELQFIDAKNKLTVYDGPPMSCHLKTQYARNKWYGVEYCKWAIKDLPGLSPFFLGFKKRDDLADCFLQGAWYLKFGQHGNRGDITSAHQKLVYAENNILSYRKVRPRAPTKKSLLSGRWTLSNIKYALLKSGAGSKDGKLVPGFKADGALLASIEFYFTTLEKFKQLN
jgi:hypothetical protein